MNNGAKALLTTIVTMAAYFVLQFVGVEMTPIVQEGFIVGGLLIYGIFSKDVTDKPAIKQPTTITAIVAAAAWLLTVVFKIEIPEQMKQSAAGLIIGILGLYSVPPEKSKSFS